MDRLKHYLQETGIPTDELASRSGLAAERVRALMEGAPATVQDLHALSKALSVPMRRLVLAHKTGAGPEPSFLFRGIDEKERLSSPGAIEKVEQYIAACAQVLPERNGPPMWLNELDAGKGLSYEEAHRLAHNFRARFTPNTKNDPITDLPAILDSLGVIISTINKSRYEGASAVFRGYGFAFISPRFEGRMLFTLAHELGHLLAHHRDGSSATFDTIDQFKNWENGKSEAFANYFASVVLLPDQAVGMALQSIRSAYKIQGDSIGDIEISVLARYYGVSFDVAALRCEMLGLLPRGGAISLSIQIKKEFGSAEKRAEEIGLPARNPVNISKVPQFLLTHIVSGVEDGKISAGWAAENFGMTVSELYRSHAELRGSDGLRH